jgi:hypothetical protein
MLLVAGGNGDGKSDGTVDVADRTAYTARETGAELKRV